MNVYISVILEECSWQLGCRSALIETDKNTYERHVVCCLGLWSLSTGCEVISAVYRQHGQSNIRVCLALALGWHWVAGC